MVSGILSMAGLGTGSGFVAGIWKRVDGLGRSSEAGGVTDERMGGDRMKEVGWVDDVQSGVVMSKELSPCIVPVCRW